MSQNLSSPATKEDVGLLMDSLGRIELKLVDLEERMLLKIGESIQESEERTMGHIRESEERMTGHIRESEERTMGHIRESEERTMGHIRESEERTMGHIRESEERTKRHMDVLMENRFHDVLGACSDRFSQHDDRFVRLEKHTGLRAA